MASIASAGFKGCPSRKEWRHEREKKDAPVGIQLPKLQIERFDIDLVGESALICHAWSDKAKKMMLDKQMKRAKGGKEAKSPEQDFEDSLYPHPDGGYEFPAVAFKAAAVDPCSYLDGMTKVAARGSIQWSRRPVFGQPGESRDLFPARFRPTPE